MTTTNLLTQDSTPSPLDPIALQLELTPPAQTASEATPLRTALTQPMTIANPPMVQGLLFPPFVSPSSRTISTKTNIPMIPLVLCNRFKSLILAVRVETN
jgi:hypothetical protein